MEVTYYEFLMLMKFKSLEVCQQAAMQMNYGPACVEIMMVEEVEHPYFPPPLPRPEIIERMSL